MPLGFRDHARLRQIQRVELVVRQSLRGIVRDVLRVVVGQPY
jgi:hypothetical protein